MKDNVVNMQSVITLSVSNGDEMAINAKAPVYLINNILEDDSHGIIDGASMAYKTFVALRMVHSVCTGADFMGNTVYKTGKVLYVCGEGMGALSRRIKALRTTSGDFNNNLIVLDTPVFIDDVTHMAALRGVIEDQQPVLVIFDTFSSLTSVTQENDNAQVAACLNLVKNTCRTDTNTSSLIVHHLGKDAAKGSRGASAFLNNTDFSFQLEKQDGMITILSCKKQKDGEHFDDIAMKAHVIDLGLTRQDGDSTTSLVLEHTNESLGKKSSEGMPTQDEIHVMNAMQKVYIKSACPIPLEIIERYSIDKRHAVILISDWREEAYKRLSVDCKKGDESAINNAKKAKFSRVRKALFKKNRIVEHGGYAWYYHYNKNLENDKQKSLAVSGL